MKEEEAKELTAMVKRIYIAVIGDKDAGIEGLVPRVEKHDQQLVTIQKVFWSITGGITVIGAIWGIIKLIA